ncbi:MAG: triose-phosphate isomerase [Pseudomonadales bacterium]|nr:triose-phosphate isomerase [Pseudomonadales bacterium]
MRQRWVIGNWKMHGRRQQNAQLIHEIISVPLWPGLCVAVAPPAIYLQQVHELLIGSGVVLAAQMVSEYEQGAHTGQCAAGMLADMGVQLVLAGHSECRHAGQTDAQVALQVKRVLEQGMSVVLCVGETLEQHERGETLDVVRKQLEVIAGLGAEVANRLLLAYEPVWAIGTGRVASPGHAQWVHQALRSTLAKSLGEPWAMTPILYGGSVKADNAAELLSQLDVDGVLVGGASLKASEFLSLCRLAAQAR